jgi:hypothetical protein
LWDLFAIYFRLVVTANTQGTGEGNAYCGAQMLNMAFGLFLIVLVLMNAI